MAIDVSGLRHRQEVVGNISASQQRLNLWLPAVDSNSKTSDKPVETLNVIDACNISDTQNVQKLIAHLRLCRFAYRCRRGHWNLTRRFSQIQVLMALCIASSFTHRSWSRSLLSEKARFILLNATTLYLALLGPHWNGKGRQEEDQGCQCC